MNNHWWTDKELEIIKKWFQVASDDEIARFLPGRTLCAISHQRRKLNLKYDWEFMKQKIAEGYTSPLAQW